MSWQFTFNGTANSAVNVAPATGAVVMFTIKEMLKQNGWVVKASGDGTSLFSATDGITTGASGAGGMANTNAWFRIQDPATVREFTAQRGSASNQVWRIKWSHSAKFTGGSQSATVTPSATDEQIYKGAGTDASPTFATIFATDNTYHLHCGGETAAPYHWYYVCLTSASPALNSRGHYITLANGSYPSQDVAPYVFDFGNTNNLTNNSIVTNMGSGYFKKGLSGEAFVAFGAGFYTGFVSAGSTISIPSVIGINPYTGNDSGAPIPVGRSSAQTSPGWKGFLPMDVICYPQNTRNIYDFEDTTATAWAASTSYAIDQRVSNSSNIYLCIVAGTSAGSGGPTQTVGSQTDNTVTWLFLSPVSRYTVINDVMIRSPAGVILA